MKESTVGHVFSLLNRTGNTVGKGASDGKVEWKSVVLKGGNSRGCLGWNGRTAETGWLYKMLCPGASYVTECNRQSGDPRSPRVIKRPYT